MPRLRLTLPLLALFLIPLFLPSEKAADPAPVVHQKTPRSLSHTTPSFPNLPNKPSFNEPDLTLPPLNHAPLLSAAKELEKKGRYRFATARLTNITPHREGTWTSTPDRAHWHYHLQSTEAQSLNLAFSEFYLPAGGQLTISDPSGKSEPLTFTSADNDSHQQLWTPILPTDQLTLTLDLPKELAPNFRLRLSQINHGFRPQTPRRFLKAIGDSSSGSCNVDVICDPSDDPTFGPLVDLYRDQIRSVAAYTIGGIETCSGALINNTRNDLTPYFLTAAHCEITAQNAPSVIVYWNFENSSCRTPGSSASGSNGDGPLRDFNSGAIFRAARTQSDFCLIELDDPVSPSFLPFYAGWDRSGVNPPSVTGIHHPAVAEKRISFELGSTRITNAFSDSQSSSGTHFRVADWDFGTTEGGSSGSPLFDDSGNIIGQLEGGDAACENDLPDWYGRLSRSWADGGTPATQLSSWLDPDATQAITHTGINSDEILTVSGNAISEGNSGSTTTSATVTLSKATTETVTVTLITEVGSATQDDFTALSQAITFNPGETSKTIPISIIGDHDPEEHESFLLRLINPQNAAAPNQPAQITILNDDYIAPIITSPLSVNTSAQSNIEYRITAQNTPTSFSLINPPSGMTISPLTGVISWIPTTPGSISVDIVATNPADSDQETLTFIISENTLANALDLPSFIPLINVSPQWSSQTTTTNDGVDAAQTAPLLDGESARFSIQVTGPDRMSFDWKVSSEEGFDGLRFLLDGQALPSLPAISGEVDWTTALVTIPSGTHTLTWEYAKDGSESNGLDTAWVDDIRLASGQRPIIWVNEDNLAITGSTTRLPLEFINATSFSLSNLPTWLSYDEDLNQLVGIPPSSGTFSITATAMSANEASTRSFSLTAITRSPDLSAPLDQTNLITASSGNSPWTIASENSAIGGSLAQSGQITDNQDSKLTLLVQGPGTLRFRWRVSSEEGFDILSYSLNGTPLAEISGELDWELIELPLTPGTHHITWSYRKDDSESSGDDAGFLDSIILTGFANFLNENGLDHSSVLPSDDPEGNALSLLHEYAFLIPPGAASNRDHLTLTRMNGSANLSFHGLLPDSGIQYLLETSPSLLMPSWTPLTGSLQSTPQTDSAQYSHTFSIPSPSHGKRFYRVRARFQ